MQRQRQPAPTPATASRAKPRPEFVAAVRYLDGRRDIFHVRFADDIEDARALVRSELGDLRSLLIAPRG